MIELADSTYVSNKVCREKLIGLLELFSDDLEIEYRFSWLMPFSESQPWN
jgi:hypothetical protein